MSLELPQSAATPGAGVAPAHERADAARNRQRILQVARALVAEHGIEAVGMDDVARAACVGTGTLYRRFGDRAGLVLALLEERERKFQDAVLRGPAPLGPGAPPRERLHAFGRAYLEIVEEHSALIAAAVASGPLVGGPWEAYRLHLRVLLDEAQFAGDLEYATTALMQTLHPALHRHLRLARGWSLERIGDGFAALVDAWLGFAPTRR